MESDGPGSSDHRFSGKRKLSSDSCDEREAKKLHSDPSANNGHKKHKKHKKRDLLELSVVSRKDGIIELENGKRFRKVQKKKKKSKEELRDDFSNIVDNTEEVDVDKCVDGSLVKHKKKKKHKDKSLDLESVALVKTSVSHDSLGDEHDLVKHKKKKKHKDKEKDPENPAEHYLAKRKKKKKHKNKDRTLKNETGDSGDTASIDGHQNEEVPGEQCDYSLKKHKKKKKCKDKDPVEIINPDQVTTNDKAEVSGFIVDALSDVFSKPKKKKKRLKEERLPEHFPTDSVADNIPPDQHMQEEQLGSLIPPADSLISETPEDSLNISKLLKNNSVSGVLDSTDRLIDKIDANRALSSTPTRARKRQRKLANRSSLNLLSNPEETVRCNSSFILDSSMASSLDVSLPGTQESSRSLSLPSTSSLLPSQDQSMPVDDQTDLNPSASSVSWHVPETRVVDRITPKKSFIKNLVKTAVSQVLSEPIDTSEQVGDRLEQTNEGVDPLDNIYEEGVDPLEETNGEAVDLLDQKYSQTGVKPLTPGHRRSIANYEELCKTFLADPASALQRPSTSSGGGNKRREKSKKAAPPVERNDSLSSAGDTPRDRSRSKKVKTSSTQNMGTNNNSSELTLRLNSLHLQPATAQKKVTIGDLYRLPSRKKVPLVLFQACQFICSQKIAVSQLNNVYTGHCVPREREYRRILRRKFGAKFGNFYEEQDLMILRRFNTLIENRVVEDKAEFCTFLNTYCNGNDQKELHRSRRSIGVRNIVGLYVGQDMPHKIAAVSCLRLIKLVLGASNLFRNYKAGVVGEPVTSDSQPQEEQTQDDLSSDDDEIGSSSQGAKAGKTRRVVNKWTMEEDQTLMDLVLGRDGVTMVQNVDPMMVDWDGISQQFPGRKTQYVREHWCRVIQPALVEDSEPDAILNYRRRLLEEVVKMGAGHKKDIHWTKLTKIFHPRSTYSIQHNFNDLIKGGRASEPIAGTTEFQERVAEALAKVDRLAQLPEHLQAKFFVSIPYKEQLKDYYLALVSPQSGTAPTNSESGDSSSSP